MPSSAPPSWTRRPTAALLAAVTAIVMAGAGCGGSGNGDADPATIAPQGAAVYVTATVRPEGDQKDAVDQIARKVFKAQSAGQRIQQLLDKGFKSSQGTRNLTYKDDVDTWLGKRAALVLTRVTSGSQHQGAVILDAKDTGKAADMLERQAKASTPKLTKRTYKGVDYWFDPGDGSGQGVVGNFVAAGSEPDFKAVVDASKGRGLVDNSQFKQVAGQAADKLAFGYVDPRSLVAGASSSGIPPGVLQTLLRTGNSPATFSVDAKPDRVTVDSRAQGAAANPAAGQPSILVPKLPGDSWLALGVPQLGQSLRRATAQLGAGGTGQAVLNGIRQAVRAQTGLDLDRDIFAALGDVAFFARGSNILTLGAGMVVQSPDPGAARRVVAKLRPLLTRMGAHSGLRVAPANVGGAQGFKVASSRLPGVINVVVRGDRMVVAYGDAATREAFSAASPLSNAPEFKAAQQSLGGAQPTLFVSFPPLASLVGTQSSPNAQKAKTYLSALKTLAAGAQVKGNTQTGHLVLTLK